MAEIPLIERTNSTLGPGTPEKTYAEIIYNRRRTYKPPVGGPIRRPFQYVGGGIIPGWPGPGDKLPSVTNGLLINPTDFLLINSTDKFII